MIHNFGGFTHKPDLRTYIAIDLKSFYASVECVERGLDPLSTNLVVADAARTSKTICLAVSPSMKAHGIPGRPRLFEVEQKIKTINRERKGAAQGRKLTGKSWSAIELAAHTDWEIDYIAAPPRMALYVDYSTRIYEIYLQYIAPEDIHVYSIDEVFMDVTDYLELYHATPHELAMRMIRHVLRETGITATAGIGTNMYLCKVAMDIVAKHIPADEHGVRIAELNETSYRQKLWHHTPLTAFWRIGRGTAERLRRMGITTMGQLARCSLEHEDLLYRMFGINAELLIDHAWGWESCTMADVKAYRPETHSLSSSQVLSCPYTYDKALVVITEMADAMALDLYEQGLMADQIGVVVNYDTESIASAQEDLAYEGAVVTDHYGRTVPKPVHGTEHLTHPSNSSRIITHAVRKIYERVVDKRLFIRRLTLTAGHVITTAQAERLAQRPRQLKLFTDSEQELRKAQAEQTAIQKEQRMQQAVLAIRQQYGKNAILRGTSFAEGATARERNLQIGGHKA